jgi:site-specific DNA-methyltransferase (adenine-specific)
VTSHRVIHGDCTKVLRDLARQAVLVDAVVTDPPYHLASIVARLGQPDSAPIQSGATGVYARSSQGFMGQQWDGGDVAFRPDTWRRVFDVMKPGAHLVAFAATKGYHRMACAIEDAGFEIRDMIAWLYGTGFPKSHNLDGEWDGWGSALKPAIEPIVFAQKPCSETSIAANVARWGVGAINIDASRIAGDDMAVEREGEASQDQRYTDAGAVTLAAKPGRRYKVKRFAPGADVNKTGNWKQEEIYEGHSKPGRWPANVCHDGSDEVLDAFARFGERGAAAPVFERHADKFRNVYNGSFVGNIDEAGATFQGDTGTAARFFYSSKATQGERVFECRICAAHQLGKPDCSHTDDEGQPLVDLRTHPTVKPAGLMEWLVCLITPPAGLVLDPFAGTGTTAAAARAKGLQSLSIEADENHVRDIGVRLSIDVAQLLAAKVSARPVDHGDQFDMFGGGA